MAACDGSAKRGGRGCALGWLGDCVAAWLCVPVASHCGRAWGAAGRHPTGCHLPPVSSSGDRAKASAAGLLAGQEAHGYQEQPAAHYVAGDQSPCADDLPV